jgi:hypothetical protein
VAVEPGQTYEGLDFGNWRAGSLSGVKFHDQNGNGVRDSGEPGLAGWTIVGTAGTGSWRKIGFELVTREDDPLTDFDEAGLFARDEFEPGHYWIRETPQEGWVQTAPPSGEYQFDLRSGESVDGLIFGNRRIDEPQFGSIHGQKWHDRNANGTRDPDEPGLDGWVVVLENPLAGAPPSTTTTHSVDLNGDGQIDPVTERGLYSFEHVPPFTYFVYEVAQPGWKLSSPAEGRYEVTVAVGQSLSGLDFGNYRSTFLQGQKWHDLNGDGQRANDEPTLDGWTILLIDARTGQVVDRQITRSEDTNGDDRLDPRSERGFYRFEDVAPGPYLLMEEPQIGWQQSAPSAGTHFVELQPGQTAEHLDFGNWRPATIHGTKFLDHDGDGTRDPDDVGLPGWTIVVEGTDGRGRPVRRQVVTSADEPTTRVDEAGRYVVEGLPPGRYEVVERLLPGWQQTWPDRGVHRVELTSDESAGPLDFGNRPRRGGAVQGVKWHDLDADGVRDPDEPGLAGWTIHITTLDLSPLPGVDRTTVTEEDDPQTPENEAGRYRFDDLPLLRPYWVQEVLQPGWQQSAPSNGGHLATLSEPGQVLEGLDFGNWQAATVYGLKWFDQNGNGVRDGRDHGMSSVMIYSDLNGNKLLDADEPRTMSQADDPHTRFDEAGHYLLEGLRPGRHTIREVAPGPEHQTYPLAGFHEVVLASGQTAGSFDFGSLTLPGDINLDGRVDLTDFGLLKLNFGIEPRPAVVPGWRQGDFNGDLTVDLTDFGILKEHFGERANVPRPSEDALAAAVDWALAYLDADDEDWGAAEID